MTPRDLIRRCRRLFPLILPPARGYVYGGHNRAGDYAMLSSLGRPGGARRPPPRHPPFCMNPLPMGKIMFLLVLSSEKNDIIVS